MRMFIKTIAATLCLAVPALAQPYNVKMLEIKGDPPTMASPFSMFGDTTPTLGAYIERLHTAADEAGLEALVVRMKDAVLTSSEIEEIGQAIGRVRDNGKRVYLFAENFGPAELLMGSHADESILQLGGMVSLPGLYMEEIFLADTLAWAGLEADFVQIGDYKGANEMMTRSSPSEAWEENISGLLDAMYANLRDTIKVGRGLDDAGLDHAMDRAWMADGATAIEVGLIDAEVDLTELFAHVEARANDTGWGGDGLVYRGELGDRAGPRTDFSNPFMVLSQLFQPARRGTTGPTIAILHIDGAIIDGDSTPAGPFSSTSVGSRTIRNAIKKLASDGNIKGVIVRIDSPGGSAIASEVIWQGLQRLSAEKPVWVSVNGMAASGGYYIAVGGQRIYVNPSSIVGSIGVVGGKISIGGLLDKAHVHVVGRARGPHADMFSMMNGWDDARMALIREKISETYELFASRVTHGRPGIDLSKVAEGRLFLGHDAVRLGMADEIGTLEDAIADLATTLDLDEFDVMDFPDPPTFEEFLSQAFGGFISAPIGSQVIGERLSLIRATLGDKRFAALRDAFTLGVMLRSEPVLLTSPRILVFE